MSKTNVKFGFHELIFPNHILTSGCVYFSSFFNTCLHGFQCYETEKGLRRDLHMMLCCIHYVISGRTLS